MSFDKPADKPANQEKIQQIGFQLMEIFNEENIAILAAGIKVMSPDTKKRMEYALKEAGINIEIEDAPL